MVFLKGESEREFLFITCVLRLVKGFPNIPIAHVSIKFLIKDDLNRKCGMFAKRKLIELNYLNRGWGRCTNDVIAFDDLPDSCLCVSDIKNISFIKKLEASPWIMFAKKGRSPLF